MTAEYSYPNNYINAQVSCDTSEFDSKTIDTCSHCGKETCEHIEEFVFELIKKNEKLKKENAELKNKLSEREELTVLSKILVQKDADSYNRVLDKLKTINDFTIESTAEISVVVRIMKSPL